MELSISEKIREKVKLLPAKPGVYIMHAADGTVIYVGKAKVLKNRVKSYFDGSQKTVKTYALVSNVDDFEYIITNSELDAFSLESNLIKKYKPHYNILLKDDKSFPYIRINLKERFPRVTVARRPKKDGSLLFGPYVTGIRIGEMMSLIKWAYPVRWCNKNFDDGKVIARPCLHGQMGDCLAPCAFKEREVEYNKTIRKVINFLNGDTKDIKKQLTEKMNKYSAEMKYEEALEIRNLLEAVEVMDSSLITSLTTESDIDVFALCQGEDIADINVMKVRAGKNVGQFNYPIEDAVGEKHELLASFIANFYQDGSELPREILLESFMQDSKDLLENFIRDKFGKKVNVLYPVRGVKKQLLDSTTANAEEYVTNSRDRFIRHKKLTTDALEELCQITGLSRINRIEGYDISNISGTDSVASMVVFEGGEPDKSQYRKFKIKTVEGADDFASMYETLYRRVRDLVECKEGFNKRPDLILIDGGLGQLHSAEQAIASAGANIPVISLAKQDEEIFVSGSSVPVRLDKSNYALRLLQRVRDEAHRFAVMFHRNLRGQSMTSFLLELPGIGKATSQKIWKHFKTKEDIFNAKPEDFALIDGISDIKALEIHKAIHEKEG